MEKEEKDRSTEGGMRRERGKRERPPDVVNCPVHFSQLTKRTMRFFILAPSTKGCFWPSHHYKEVLYHCTRAEEVLIFFLWHPCKGFFSVAPSQRDLSGRHEKKPQPENTRAIRNPQPLCFSIRGEREWFLMVLGIIECQTFEDHCPGLPGGRDPPGGGKIDLPAPKTHPKSLRNRSGSMRRSFCAKKSAS